MILALALILGGGFLAHKIQTSGGIRVRDVRFVGSGGKLISALLYVPPGASKKSPAPGIVAIHGYINSRETQDGFAIEFARRGYVVLATDQSGHGFSDPPAFANGFGGPDALTYLRTLDIVDPANVALEGHSMGGWASVIAAAAQPAAYKSIVLASSCPGLFGAPPGTPTFPRNLGLIYGAYDEFSGLMWASPIPGDMNGGANAEKLFDTSAPVAVDRLYGSIEDGTARKLFRPSLIHARVHLSTEAIGDAVAWMQATLTGGNALPPADQIWYWKEFGTLAALIGMLVLLFPLGALLMDRPYFQSLQESPGTNRAAKGIGWWLGGLVMVLLPLPVYVWAWTFNGKGIAKASRLWGQQITTTVMFWALGVAAISILLFLLWHFMANRKQGADFADYGLTWKTKGMAWGKVGRSLLAAVLLVLGAYLSLIFSDWAFKTDYRFWVFAIKPMSRMHFGIFLGYIVPFAFYFLVTGLVLHGQMRRTRSNGTPLALWQEMAINAILLVAGYFVFFAYQYIPLFSGGTMSIAQLHLPTIVMFQYVPMFIIVALVSTYFFRKTGHIYVGAFTNALLVTWIIVAGQATHYPY
ncbi:MAG: alpha/beta fold hydrolase [Desulfobacterales bacterium]|nr:alpha/beta fold hydrolase [Desulfobacterales bacterium]